MTAFPLLHGAALALGLVLPLGPQDLFILQQGAAESRWRRIAPVVIAAGVADTLLILAAVSGAGAILPTGGPVMAGMLAAGIVFLAWTGWLQWRAKDGVPHQQPGRCSTVRKIGSTVALAVLNPHAILDFVAVIGPSSLTYDGVDRWLFAGGCIVNSWLWFPLLALAGHHACKLLESERNRTIGVRMSAVLLWASAGLLAVTLSHSVG